jgi:hypothetical protein
LLDAFEHGSNGTNLVIATGNRGVDEFLCQRLAIAADVGKALQIIARGKTNNLARRGILKVPEVGFVAIGVEAKREVTAPLLLDVVAVLLGLLTN